MSKHEGSDETFSIRIIDAAKNCYRDYYFINDSQDIQNKIFYHIKYFVQNTIFHDHPNISEVFASLCHKVNLVKYHLKKYREVEDKIEAELLDCENSIGHDGTVLIERLELTAEYESFLIQAKATLDILVKFLNIIYRNGQKNPIKLQSTFSDKGKGVIKSIENYQKNNPEDREKLSELVGYLRDECINHSDQEPDSINWLISIINNRDTIAHYRKHEYFAFQLSYFGKEKSIIRPHFTKSQTVLESFEVAYDNLLVFIQDFIALLLIPYLDKGIRAYTFRREDVILKVG